MLDVQTDAANVTKSMKTNTAKPEPKKERHSLRNAARRMVVKNPNISVEEMLTVLTQQGYTPDRDVLAQYRNSVRDVLRVIVQEGIKEIRL
jgi:hypothetical protein